MKAKETGNKNLTPGKLNPEGLEAMQRGGEEFPPSSKGDASRIIEVRSSYMSPDSRIGSIPAPMTADGRARGRTAARALVFVDRLGERLAFERNGTRLYQAFLGKVLAADGQGGGADPSQIRHFLSEEHEHFMMLQAAMERVGGDPTAMTPAANVAAVASDGIIKVVSDPRTTVSQCIDVILIAELTDHDGWELLIQLAEAAGETDMVKQFQEALQNEQEHLTTIRQWARSSVMSNAGLSNA